MTVVPLVELVRRADTAGPGEFIVSRDELLILANLGPGQWDAAVIEAGLPYRPLGRIRVVRTPAPPRRARRTVS